MSLLIVFRHSPQKGFYFNTARECVHTERSGTGKGTQQSFPSSFHTIQVKGRNGNLFCVKNTLSQSHRADLNCTWILHSTAAWLFMVFTEYSRCSLRIINTVSRRHPLRLMIYNCKQDIASPAFPNTTKLRRVLLDYVRRADRTCHSTKVPLW